MKLSTIKQMLKEKVVGQDEAIDKVISCVYKYYLKINHDLDVPSPNILLIGDSGIGKTHLSHCIASILNIPCIEINGAVLTQNRFDGISILDYVHKNKMQLMGSDPRAIIYIDEFDKLVAPAHNIKDENTSEGVQAELLKMLEGGTIDCDKKDNTITAKNILFIFSGAFSTLFKKEKKANAIGFTKNNIEQENEIILEDKLIEFGILRELLGRIKSIVKLNSLSKAMLEAYNASKLSNTYKFQNLEELKDFRLNDHIIQNAMEAALHKNLGIRGYEVELEKKLDDYITAHIDELEWGDASKNDEEVIEEDDELIALEAKCGEIALMPPDQLIESYQKRAKNKEYSL